MNSRSGNQRKSPVGSEKRSGRVHREVRWGQVELEVGGRGDA